MVAPGKTAALSPWCAYNAIVYPIYITNTLILEMGDKMNNPKMKALLKGYEKEFNAALPLIHPKEHIAAVRLALLFMRKSKEG